MKQILNILIVILLFSCNNKNKLVNTAIAKVHTKIIDNDTLVQTPVIIIAKASRNELKALKSKHGEEDFYIISDDAMFYISEIRNLLIKNN